MSPHNLHQPQAPGAPLKFKLKDGLFEYRKNILEDSERDRALQWVTENVPPLDDDLCEFMELAEHKKRQRKEG